MKCLLSLALAGSALAGMHGYNNCYLASSSGLQNLAVSNIGLHVDSTLHSEDGRMIRLTYKDGFLWRNDEIRDEIYVHHGDTLTSVFAGGTMTQEYVVDQDLILQMSQISLGAGFGLLSTITYTKDSIARFDSIAMGPTGSIGLLTRDVFTADSLYSFGRLSSAPGAWFLNRRCQASPTGCNCSDRGQWILSAGKIEEWHDTLTATYYTSTTPGTSVRVRPNLVQPTGTRWRADGSVRSPSRNWMPVYKASVPE